MNFPFSDKQIQICKNNFFWGEGGGGGEGGGLREDK